MKRESKKKVTGMEIKSFIHLYSISVFTGVLFLGLE